MGMAAYNHLKSRGCRIDLQVLQNVQHIDRSGARLDDLGECQGLCPSTTIHIPADCNHRSYLSEGVEDFWCAYVTSMEDEVRIVQRTHGFFTQQSMRIGNQSENSYLLGQTFP